MGFLTKLFGKKSKDRIDPEEPRSAEQGDEEAALTDEEERAAEAAEQSFFAENPDLAEEDMLNEELRLEREEEQRAREETGDAEDVCPAVENGTEPVEPEDETSREDEEVVPAEETVAGTEEAEPSVEEELSPTEENQPEDTATKKSFWGRLKAGLTKTRDALFTPVDKLLKSFTKVDEDLLEELEEILISADVGMNATEAILDQLRVRIKDGRLKEKEQVMDALREIMTDMIGESQPLQLNTSPSVILVIGVNGAGKTTSIGKIAKRLKLQGKRVVVAAADTFRAAAIDQLAVWCERANVEMVKQSEGSDPAAVVFDAIAVAKKREADVLIIDTAGRLQNKKNLMNELAKIDRVIDRELPDASRETLLVLDATTGQNAVSQAKEFSQAAHITGITLNKLDGTAKGGIVIAIKQELGIPVKFIGVGEKIDDMQEFDAADFVRALFGE